MVQCTKESHATMKSDPKRWTIETETIGAIDLGPGQVVVLVNCRECHSTLAVELFVDEPARAE